MYLFVWMIGTAGVPCATMPAEPPRDVTQLWSSYNACALPLDIEVVQEWMENGVRFQRLYFTSEIYDGVPARIYAITGVPIEAKNVPGVLHLHGGGQTAFTEWVRYWTKRGYAAVSIDWCGEVAGRKDFARWGAIKANMMKDGQDRTTSPSVRASPWYHWAVAGRRSLTLLEHLPGVDRVRLGLFGVSMGATLTWLVAGTDPRVKTAVPIYGCGWNTYPDVHSGGGYAHPVPPEIDLWRATMEPETYARYITCPLLLLSATNDFHTHMERAYDSLARVHSLTRQSFTPRYSHHLEPEQGRTLEAWMRDQLQTPRIWPQSPRVAAELKANRLTALVTCDRPDEVKSILVLMSRGSKRPQTRFWRTLMVKPEAQKWRAELPILERDLPLRVIANVTYEGGFTLTSGEMICTPSSFDGVQVSENRTLLIDDFHEGIDDWTFGPAYTDPHIDWSYMAPARGPEGQSALSLNPIAWGQNPVKYTFGTYKVGDPRWTPPPDARLVFRFRSELPAQLEVHALFDHWGPHSREYVLPARLKKTTDWQNVEVDPTQGATGDGRKLTTWTGLDRIDFVGQSPAGRPPAFADVHWSDVTTHSSGERSGS